MGEPIALFTFLYPGTVNYLGPERTTVFFLNAIGAFSNMATVWRELFPISKMAAMTRFLGEGNPICQMISMKKFSAPSPVIFSIPLDYFVFNQSNQTQLLKHRLQRPRLYICYECLVESLCDSVTFMKIKVRLEAIVLLWPAMSPFFFLNEKYVVIVVLKNPDRIGSLTHSKGVAYILYCIFGTVYTVYAYPRRWSLQENNSH